MSSNNKYVEGPQKRAQLKHHIQEETTQKMHSSYNVQVTTARREGQKNMMIQIETSNSIQSSRKLSVTNFPIRYSTTKLLCLIIWRPGCLDQFPQKVMHSCYDWFNLHNEGKKTVTEAPPSLIFGGNTILLLKLRYLVLLLLLVKFLTHFRLLVIQNYQVSAK